MYDRKINFLCSNHHNGITVLTSLIRILIVARLHRLRLLTGIVTPWSTRILLTRIEWTKLAKRFFSLINLKDFI